jgi:hypothetical protein
VSQVAPGEPIRVNPSWTYAVPTSRDTRTFLLLTVAITVGIRLWASLLARNNYELSDIFFTLFTELDSWGAAGLLMILIVAAFSPSSPPIPIALRWIGDHPNRVAVTTGAVLCAGSLLVYQNHPLAMDEYAQLFQSRVFAAGHLSAKFPAPLLDWLIPPGFQNHFLVVSKQTGAVASAYWPSFALLLTPFSFLGIPWACNPLISALTLIVIHRMALRLFADHETAGLAVLLTVCSPVFFANGISYYSMPAHLLANAIFALLLLEPTPRRAFFAGLAGSVALTLHNPVPHMLFALPWLLWLAWRPGRVGLLASVAAGYAPLCLLLGIGWFWFTMHLRQANLDTVPITSERLEHVQHLGQVFSLPNLNTLLARLIGLAKVWVWAVPGLLILASNGAWRLWRDPFCRLLACSALCTIAGYLFVPLDQGHGWGFRYFHSAWLALPLLAAGSLRAGETRLFVVKCALATLVLGVGLRAWQMHDFIARDLRQLPAYTGNERRVVILDPSFAYYGPDLVQNDPWLRTNEIRMITAGRAEDAAMLHEHFNNLHQVYADRYGSVWSSARIYPREHPLPPRQASE